MVALLLISSATGCAGLKKNDPPPPAAPDFCATASPIYVEKIDQISDATAREILKHNMTGRKLCGW